MVGKMKTASRRVRSPQDLQDSSHYADESVEVKVLSDAGLAVKCAKPL